MFYLTAGERCKRLRKQNNWSVEQLAEEAGVSVHTVYSFEADKAISSSAAISIAFALGIPPTTLLSGFDDAVKDIEDIEDL